MREILFRGKRLQGGAWVEGYFFKSDINERERSSGKATLIFTPDCDTFIMIPEAHNSVMVRADTVGQWTGLTDKNGVKIFEGDIIRFDGEEFVVFWNGEAFQWQAKSTQAKENAIIYDAGNPFSQLNEFANAFDFGWIAAEPILSGEMTTEVVGNIHDNRLEGDD